MRRRISIALNPVTDAHLDALVSTGLFGFTRSDVARRLLDAQFVLLGREGWVPMDATLNRPKGRTRRR